MLPSLIHVRQPDVSCSCSSNIWPWRREGGCLQQIDGTVSSRYRDLKDVNPVYYHGDVGPSNLAFSQPRGRGGTGSGHRSEAPGPAPTLLPLTRATNFGTLGPWAAQVAFNVAATWFLVLSDPSRPNLEVYERGRRGVGRRRYGTVRHRTAYQGRNSGGWNQLQSNHVWRPSLRYLMAVERPSGAAFRSPISCTSTWKVRN